MAVHVVDLFEMVDIGENQCQGPAVAGNAVPLDREPLVDGASIGQAGEGVTQGQVPEAPGGLPQALVLLVEVAGLGAREPGSVNQHGQGFQGLTRQATEVRRVEGEPVAQSVAVGARDLIAPFKGALNHLSSSSRGRRRPYTGLYNGRGAGFLHQHDSSVTCSIVSPMTAVHTPGSLWT